MNGMGVSGKIVNKVCNLTNVGSVCSLLELSMIFKGEKKGTCCDKIRRNQKKSKKSIIILWIH